jgi:hypothetical protein
MLTVTRSAKLPLALATTALIGSAAAVIAKELPTVVHSTPFYLAQQQQAPLGSYTAQMGGTARTARRTGAAATSTDSGTTSTTTGETASGIASRRASRTTAMTAGKALDITLSSYSPSAELQAIAKAGSGNISSAINAYNHGSVTIEGVTYPINVAVSSSRNSAQGSYYVVRLISTKPFSGATAQGSAAKGNTVGMIELSMPTAEGATGTGQLYRSTQVTVSKSGEISTQGGTATATLLTNVQKAQ